MGIRRVVSIAGLVLMFVGVTPVIPAAADHCSHMADVQRQRDGDVGGYHSIGCTPEVYRIRLYFEGIYCNSDEQWECGDPEGPQTVVYSTYKECFNTVFCRGRRVMADQDVPASWYCAGTWGLIENTEGGTVERKRKRWKCEYMG
jgi:hypothetical protein